MKTIAIVNTAAGSTGASSPSRLRQALAALGEHDAEVMSLDLENPTEHLSEVASRGPDRLIVWGGDGTHRTALNAIGRTPSSLILLPGGTRNLLTRSLHGDNRWDIILREILASSQIHSIPAGEVNGERFFCALLAGAPAYFAHARETFRHGDVATALGEVGAALDTIQDLRLVARYGDSDALLDHSLPNTSVIAALVGPFSRNRRMEVAALPHPSIMTTLDVIWSSFHSGFRDLPGIFTAPADILEVEMPDNGKIPAMADGEVMTIGSRMRARFLECGGYCLRARAGEHRST